MTRSGLSPTLAALNNEWQHLAGQPVPPSWGARLSCALGSECLATVLDAVRDDPDGVLLALLTLQRDGDALAGRVVVQAMLGKLVLQASRDAEATLADYLGALWLRVATYPIERRPRRVAANLALDTLKSVKGQRARPLYALPSPAVADPLADATRVLAVGVQLGAIDPLTRRTLEVVYIDGCTSKAAAEVLGVSPEAVRWRCSKGVRALRSAVPDLMAQLVG